MSINSSRFEWNEADGSICLLLKNVDRKGYIIIAEIKKYGNFYVQTIDIGVGSVNLNNRLGFYKSLSIAKREAKKAVVKFFKKILF